MGMGFSLSKAPFEDPQLADSIQDYAWTDVFEHLESIAQDLGFPGYEQAMRNAKARACIQEEATRQEVRCMVRHYFDAGNGQISEMDAIQLINHLAKARHYFQLTPDEEASNSQSMKGYFESEEASTPWECLGNAKSRAVKSTVQELKAACLIGDIRISVFRENDASESHGEEPLSVDMPRASFTKNLFNKLTRRTS